jgi:hypothetical protein
VLVAFSNQPSAISLILITDCFFIFALSFCLLIFEFCSTSPNRTAPYSHSPPNFVVRPFRVVHEAKASHYIVLLGTGSAIPKVNFLSLRGVAEANQAPQSQFKNVVAQFIGQLCLMNQATTKFGGEGLAMTCREGTLDSLL